MLLLYLGGFAYIQILYTSETRGTNLLSIHTLGISYVCMLLLYLARFAYIQILYTRETGGTNLLSIHTLGISYVGLLLYAGQDVREIILYIFGGSRIFNRGTFCRGTVHRKEIKPNRTYLT